MLLRDIGLESRDVSDVAPYEAVIRIWGEVQRSSAASVERLFAAGCLDRRLDVLIEQIDPLLNDPETHASLAPEEITHLRRLAPYIKACCQKLAGYGIPATLVHGDLHWGNIAIKDENAIFFDWTDGCVCHPFIDLATLLPIFRYPLIEGLPNTRLSYTVPRRWTYARRNTIAGLSDAGRWSCSLAQGLALPAGCCRGD
jgi:hypothetical protein